MNKVYYNEAAIKRLTHGIIHGISSEKFHPDYIVGLTRGGLVPAVMISQYLSIPMYALHVSLRDNTEMKESNCWMAEDAFGYDRLKKNILIVDDINDSGDTLTWIKNDWQASCKPKDERWNQVWGQNVRFAVLINNEASKFKEVDYMAHSINKEENPEWCVFPWENWWE